MLSNRGTEPRADTCMHSCSNITPQTRSVTVFFSAVLIWSLPFFGNLVDFVGAFGSVTFHVFFPLLAYGALFTRTRYQKLLHYVLLGIAVVQIVYGVLSTGETLVTKGVQKTKARFGGGESNVFDDFEQLRGFAGWFLNFKYWNGK